MPQRFWMGGSSYRGHAPFNNAMGWCCSAHQWASLHPHTLAGSLEEACCEVHWYTDRLVAQQEAKRSRMSESTYIRYSVKLIRPGATEGTPAIIQLPIVVAASSETDAIKYVSYMEDARVQDGWRVEVTPVTDLPVHMVSARTLDKATRYREAHWRKQVSLQNIAERTTEMDEIAAQLGWPKV